MNLLSDSLSPRGIMRLLVVSYFIAVSLELIQGTCVLEFIKPLLPDDLATWMMRLVVLGLSMLILFNVARRPAALVLSLIVFFSSYTQLHVVGDISAFWRDLALIGALLMTAEFSAPQDRDTDWTEDTDTDTPRIVSRPPDAPVEPLNDQAFREDLDIARAT